MIALSVLRDRPVPVLISLIYALAATWGVFSGGVWASLGLGGGLLLAVAIGVSQRTFPRPHGLAVGFVCVLLALAVITSPWAASPDKAWHTTLKLATITLPLLFFFSPLVRDKAGQALRRLPWLGLLMAAAFIALSVKLFLLYSAPVNDEFAIAKLNRGFSYAAVLFWPVAAGLWLAGEKRGRRVLATLVLTYVCALLFTHSRAAQGAAILAMLTFGAAAVMPTVTLWGMRFGLLLSLSWPAAAAALYTNSFDMVTKLADSWRARVEIWDYLAYRIAERPLLGWGIGNTSQLDHLNPHGAGYLWTKTAASHPHNVVMQLWVELGLPGLALGVGLGFYALRAIARMEQGLRPFAYAAFTMIFFLLLSAYNVWTDSLWAAIILLSFLFMGLGRRATGQN